MNEPCLYSYPVGKSVIDFYEKMFSLTRKYTKAILIMDMPEACYNCKFCRELYNENGACCELTIDPDDDTLYRIISEHDLHKPDWCPLRELPEKKDTLTTLECHSNGKWTESMKAGYNACLDEIVKNCKNS